MISYPLDVESLLAGCRQIRQVNQSRFTNEKNGGLPGSHFQEQPFTLQIVTIPLEAGRAELILQPPFLAGKVRERQPNMTLALIGRVIHGDHEQFSLRALPGEDQEAIVRPISFPSGRAFQQLPLPVANGRKAQHRQQVLVKLLQLIISGLLRTADEMRRDSFLSALEMALVKKT